MTDWWSSDLSADDPYSQVPTNMRATVKQMVEGRMAAPTGAALRSPQVLNLMEHANKVDPDFDANVFKQRSTFRNELAKSAPSSFGGQRNAVNTMAGHLAEVADAADALHNKDLGFTLLTTPINAMRGLTSEQDAKIKALRSALSKYSAEATKYYAGAPGGEHERFANAANFSENGSPQSLAAAIEADRKLFQSKADIQDRQKNEIMGKHGSDIQILSPESQDAFKRVDTHIARMRGQAIPVTSPEEAAKLPKGTKILLPDGTQGVVP